jgi:hypothetical protein
MRRMMVVRMVVMVLAAALLAALIFSTFALAETLFSPTGDSSVPVIVFKSQQALEEGTKFLASGGSIFNYKVFGQYVRAIAESGSSCLIIQSKIGKKQIRITDGVHAGKVGWVHSEMVR